MAWLTRSNADSNGKYADNHRRTRKGRAWVNRISALAVAGLFLPIAILPTTFCQSDAQPGPALAPTTNAAPPAERMDPTPEKTSNSEIAQIRKPTRRLQPGWVPAADATEYFVAKDHPNASDSNTGLSLDQPFKTLNRGKKELRPGVILTIKAGAYRESLVHGKSGTEDNPIVVRAYPGDEGSVVIKGSEVVSGWTNEGNGVWSVALATATPGSVTWRDDPGEYCRRREMAFIDGTRLQQVLSAAELANGHFWVDDFHRKILHRVFGQFERQVGRARGAGTGHLGSISESCDLEGLRVEHVANGDVRRRCTLDTTTRF